MTLDKIILQRFAVRADVGNYVRIVARAHAETPLSMGFGKTRFSSPWNRFKLLYLAQDPMTAVAETIIRDRFEGTTDRVLLREELDRYSISAVRNPQPLFLLDLRHEGAKRIGRVDGCGSRQGSSSWQAAQSGNLRSHRFRWDFLHVENYQQAVRCCLRSSRGFLPGSGRPCGRHAASLGAQNNPRRVTGYRS